MFVKTFFLVLCFISRFKGTESLIVQNPLNLDEDGDNVCTRLTSQTQHYYTTITSITYTYTTTACGWFNWGRCSSSRPVTCTKSVLRTRTVDVKNVFCCYGWKKRDPSSTDCSEDAIDECSSNPCQHTCHDRPFSYVCSCDPCYTKIGDTQCKLDHCKIDNQSYPFLTVNPSNPCQDCNSNDCCNWTNNNNLQCSDNNNRTKDDHCVNGVCVGTPYSCLSCETHDGSGCPIQPGYCILEHGGKRTCFAENQYKPGNPCQWCDPGNSTSTWSSRDGVACDDNDTCTRGDICHSGLCTATPFTCNALCQYCNGNNCTLKTGFGFENNKCTCKIGGQDYGHQQLNPSNQCQWCDLYDATARGNSTWSNRPEVLCDDENKCTKMDTCKAGSCVGQGYSCQSSYPSSSCIRTSECVGDGTCRPIMRSSGTICRPAVDVCDQPERCDGSLGTCPGAVEDKITLTTGTAQLVDQTFNSIMSYQYFTDKLYIKISGFSVSCGQLTLNWFLLPSTSSCSTVSGVNGTFPNNNAQQILTGLSLQVNNRYKVAIQASDMRNNAPQLVCSGVVVIERSNHSTK